MDFFLSDIEKRNYLNTYCNTYSAIIHNLQLVVNFHCEGFQVKKFVHLDTLVSW